MTKTEKIYLILATGKCEFSFNHMKKKMTVAEIDNLYNELRTGKTDDGNVTADNATADNATADNATADNAIVDVIVNAVKAEHDNIETIPVKPNMTGIKLNKNRICALAINRAGKIRMKSNKRDMLDRILNGVPADENDGEEIIGYDVTINPKLTADKRDYIIDFDTVENDTIVAIICDLFDAVDGKQKARAEKRKTGKKPVADNATEEKETV